MGRGPYYIYYLRLWKPNWTRYNIKRKPKLRLTYCFDDWDRLDMNLAMGLDPLERLQISFQEGVYTAQSDFVWETYVTFNRRMFGCIRPSLSQLQLSYFAAPWLILCRTWKESLQCLWKVHVQLHMTFRHFVITFFYHASLSCSLSVCQ